jgi:uncharacterized protein YjbI with pentapeptide repeats
MPVHVLRRLQVALPLLGILFFSRASAQDAMPMAGPPRMVVLNSVFYGKGANSLEAGDPGLAPVATGILRRELRRYGEFSVVDSTLTADAFRRAESGGIECNTIACARSIGVDLGARWVVRSKVSKTSNLIWYISGQLIDVMSGRLLADQELELKGNSREMVPQGAASLSRRLAGAAGATPLPPLAPDAAKPAGVLDAAGVTALLAATTSGASPDLSGANLSNLDLHGLDFRRANLTKANLSGANLAGANLFSCDLTDAVAAGANLEGANLDGTTLRRANFHAANFHKASLFATILEAADLSEADLSETRIIGYMRKANLTRARLTSANIGADPGNQSMGVMRTQFVSADLTGADLSKANLFKADFSYASLRGANLTGANLSNTDMVQTDLSQADLAGADLSQADISGAIFTGARGVSQIKGLDRTRNRDKAQFDEHME